MELHFASLLKLLSDFAPVKHVKSPHRDELLLLD